MITYTLTISGNQIALLRGLKNRERGKNWGKENEVHGTGYIPGLRTLEREGLVVHRVVIDRMGLADYRRSGHFLTPRGRFILRMIEEDIAKYLRPKRKTARRIILEKTA